MKRLMGWALICALCLGWFGIAGAENFMVITGYTAIEDYYKKAVTLQEEGDTPGAIDLLTELVEYYDSDEILPQTREYSAAQLYYAYALGRIELCKKDPETPNYAFAREQLSRCGSDYYMVDAYLQYAKGMAEKESGDYAAAIADLRAVRGTLKEFTSQCINAVTECEAAYKASVVDKGKSACQLGQHETAQALYNEYLALIDYDTEVRALLDECIKTHPGPGPTPEEPVEFINAVATVPGAIKLTWKGIPENYTLRWTSDLIHGKDAMEQEVTGKSFTVTDLQPGTVYRFTISYQSVSAQIDRETRKANDYPPAEGKDKFWNGSSILIRFDNCRYDFLYSGKASYEFASEKAYAKSCKQISDRTVELFEKPISESCILFMFSTFGMPEDIVGKDYQLLLHIDGVATLTENGVFGEADEEGIVKVCANGSYLCVLVYDLFDQAVEDYSDLSGKTFRLDLLVDGKFVASADGKLQ